MKMDLVDEIRKAIKNEIVAFRARNEANFRMSNKILVDNVSSFNFIGSFIIDYNFI